ncbi:MAG: histidine phosphatase family protein [Phototrophicaceae bacterium]
MTTLWLIRHGQTDWNTEQRFQGTSDQPLNATGETQAASLAPRLQAMHFDGIYCSDLIRVKRTADLALAGNTDTVTYDARLQEFNFGAWEGMSWDEARQHNAVEFAKWVDDRNYNPHGGETIDDMVQRLDAFLVDIDDKHAPDEHLLLFAHGGTLATLVCMLLGTDPKKWWQYRFLNCTLNEVIRIKRGAILARLNDMTHLPPVI